jgi:hypothetical protein
MANASKAVAEARVNEILLILLDNAQSWDAFHYVRKMEKEEGSIWFVPEGATPLSDAMIRKYLTRAYKAMESAHEKRRGKLIRRHIARLNHLLGKCMTTGEWSVARATLRDLAEMQRLLPRPEDELKKELKQLREMLKRTAYGSGNTQTGDSPASPADRAAGADLGTAGPAAV